MTSTMITYWYKKIISFTRIIDRVNIGNDPLIATSNDAIRRIVEAALGYDDSDTQRVEVVAAEVGQGQS